MKKTPWQLICCLSIIILLPSFSQAVVSRLLVSPKRVLFVDRYRSTQIQVGNITDFSMAYEVSIVTMRRGPDGRLYEPELESEEEQSVRKMIRFSPRRAVIQPKTRQIVKLMLRKPQDLPTGEYQTRLKISPLKGKSAVPASTAKPGKTKFNMDIFVSVTFPIIIQHGDLHAQVTPQWLSLHSAQEVPSGLKAEVKLDRTGDCSAFGNVVLYHAPLGEKGKGKEIGRAQEIAVYLQEDSKEITIPLKNTNQKELASGTIRVESQPVIPGQKKARSRNRDMTFKDFPL